MKWSLSTLAIVLIGILGIGIVILFQSLTTNNENDYYLLKEITEASMLDSLDWPYYHETGNLKISKLKFVESFTRRYAESTLFVGSTYTIKFFDIMEIPPKVTIKIQTGIGSFYIAKEDFGEYTTVNNELSAILEYGGAKHTSDATYWNNTNYKLKHYTKTYYSAPAISANNDFTYDATLKKPDELSHSNIYNEDLGNSGITVPTIENISNIQLVTDQGEFIYSKLRREIDWEIHSDTIKIENGDITNMLSFDIDEFAKPSEISNVNIENRKDSCGASGNKVGCYNLRVTGHNSGSKTKVVIKFTVRWKYYEYEYNE